MQVVVNFFIKVIGAETSFLLAIVIAAYGIYGKFGASSVYGAPWAKELLSLSTGLMNGVGKFYTELEGLKAEFTKLSEKKNLELEQSANLLRDGNLLEPLFIMGEIPAECFNRTFHAGNIGMTAIDAVHSYVELSLTLPKPKDAIGQYFFAR